MALQKVYEGLCKSRCDDTYRISIYDTDYSDSQVERIRYTGSGGAPSFPIEITMIHESAEIKWDGEGDVLVQPIVGSQFDVSLLLQTALHNRIKDVIKEVAEHQLAVEVSRHNGTTAALDTESNWDCVWRGILVTESVQYAWSNLPQEISLTFTDGLSLLRDEPYLDDSDASYSTNAQRFTILRQMIGRCFEKLPHSALWGATEKYFVEQLDIYHWNHVRTGDDPDTIGSVLNKSGANQDVWYEIKDHESPYNRPSVIRTSGYTCYELIHDIMVTVGATMHHANGYFQAVSPYLQTNNSFINGKRRWWTTRQAMLDSSLQYSATTQDSGDADGTAWPNYLDYRDPEKILISSTRSFLPPIYGAVMRHTKGGAGFAFKLNQPCRIVGNQANVGVNPTGPPDPSNFNPNLGGQVGGGGGSMDIILGPTFPLQNTTSLVPGGEVLRLKGRAYRVGVPLVDGDDDLVGAQPVLKFKIKVGDHYLKQNVGVMASSNFTNDSDFGRIRLAIGNIMSTGGTDITGWRPLEFTTDPEWTTDESFFHVPVQIPGLTDPDIDTIEYDDGTNVTDFPVGMFTVRDDGNPNQMRFRNEHANFSTDFKFDIITTALPASADGHDGIEVDCELQVYANDQTLYTGSATNFNDFGLNGNTNFCQAYYIDNFSLAVGDAESDEDTRYFASGANALGSETILAGETAIATRPHSSYGEIGALVVGGSATAHRQVNPTTNGYLGQWFSETKQSNVIPTSTTGGRKNLQVLAEEYYRHRKVALNTADVELLMEERHVDLLHPTRRVLLETGTVDTVFQVQSCTHNLMQGVQTMVGYQIGRIGTGTVDVDSEAATKGDDPGTTTGSGGGQVALSKVSTGGGSGGGVTAEEQHKLDAISVDAGNGITGFTVKSGSKPLTSDQVEDASSSHKFASAAQLTQIQTNSTNIASNTSNITTLRNTIQDTTGGGGKGVYHDAGKSQGSSHISLDGTNARMQAGSSTSIVATETSPGQISFKVAAGASGLETEFEAMRLSGTTSSNQAQFRVMSGTAMQFMDSVSFAGTVSGLSAADLDDVTNAGSGIIITDAERTKLTGIEAGAEVNVDTSLSAADQTLPGNRNITMDGNFLTFKDGTILKMQYDPNDDRFEFFGGLRVQGNLETSIGGMSSGLIKFVEPTMGGSNGVILQGPSTNLSSDVTFVLPDADGSAGQFLKTDGSGNLSFATASGGGGSSTAKYVLASHSMRISMYWLNRYYFGSSSYGWDTDTAFSTALTGDTSLSDDYAHMGVVAPTDISTLKLYGTLRNDTSADNVSVYVYKGSRPNGSSSNITLTELIDIDVTVTQDRHQNIDGTKTSAGISAGDLIFISFKKTQGTNATRYVNVSYTLFAEE